MKLTTQDIRDKIIKLRDSLIIQLEFLQQAIDRDYVEMQAHFKRFGDLYYRPVLTRDVDGKAVTYGQRTEIVIEPIASKYRTTIKSLLDSIRLIEAEILPEDNPEGDSASASTAREEAKAGQRTSLREGFTAQSSKLTKTAAPEPEMEEEEETSVQPTELVAKSKPAPPRPITSTIEQTPLQDPNSKPWRNKPQTTIIPKSPITQPTPTPTPQAHKKDTEITTSLQNPAKLDVDSERLRGEFAQLKNNALQGRMQALAEKYKSKSASVKRDADDEE